VALCRHSRRQLTTYFGSRNVGVIGLGLLPGELLPERGQIPDETLISTDKRFVCARSFLAQLLYGCLIALSLASSRW
jgi:hypothetical protein